MKGIKGKETPNHSEPELILKLLLVKTYFAVQPKVVFVFFLKRQKNPSSEKC